MKILNEIEQIAKLQGEIDFYCDVQRKIFREADEKADRAKGAFFKNEERIFTTRAQARDAESIYQILCEYKESLALRIKELKANEEKKKN